MLSHVHIIKIRLFRLFALFCSLARCKTRSERAEKEITLLFVWVVSNKKPEDSSVKAKTVCRLLSAHLSIRHLSPSRVKSSRGNVMLFDDVVVPELRFVALFTKCLTFGMLLCLCVY